MPALSTLLQVFETQASPPPKDQCWLNPHRVCSVSDSIATYFVSWSFVASASHITARGCLKHTRSKFRKANCDLFYHCLLLIFKTISRWLIRFLYFLIPVTWQNVQPITFFSFATKTLLTGRLTFPPQLDMKVKRCIPLLNMCGCVREHQLSAQFMPT